MALVNLTLACQVLAILVLDSGNERKLRISAASHDQYGNGLVLSQGLSLAMKSSVALYFMMAWLFVYGIPPTAE